MNRKQFLTSLPLLFLQAVSFAQQPQEQPGREPGIRQESVFYTTIPAHDFDIITGRPTDHSVTISVLANRNSEAQIEYRETGSKKTISKKIALTSGEPKEIVLDNLMADKRYDYQLIFQESGQSQIKKSPVYHFHTQRKKGEIYTFTLTADPHLDQNCDTFTYKTMLLNAASDSADFHIDLGDTFMTDKYRTNYRDALQQYLAQRYYFGLLSPSAPLFLVQGNHDGESGQRLNGKADNMTVWSNLTRKKYFPNPLPDEFYTGNDREEPFVGLPQDYYAWEWGNALFIVLDPFWFTPRAGMDNPWERTLGKAQYDWLKTTLEKSRATFKFVFIHNLVGGVDLKGKARGGMEAAGLYEWGGQSPNGNDEFQQHRPSWEMPIHALLVKNRVTAVFHGHDHLFAQQPLDGILYQCLPQPGAKGTGNPRQAGEYGYVNGPMMSNAGYMRVVVSEQSVRLDYVSKDKTVLHSNTLKSNTK